MLTPAKINAPPLVTLTYVVNFFCEKLKGLKGETLQTTLTYPSGHFLFRLLINRRIKLTEPCTVYSYFLLFLCSFAVISCLYTNFNLSRLLTSEDWNFPRTYEPKLKNFSMICNKFLVNYRILCKIIIKIYLNSCFLRRFPDLNDFSSIFWLE